ncbi:MAG: glycosyltransferase [bacterium]
MPLGPDPTKQVYENPKTIRSSWRVPRGKKVFLAFGTIQNHKNIDLAIRALSDNPDAHLVVIGSVSSHKDKPLKYYQMLADDLGLSKRVYISDEFVADEKRLSYFKAADFILLTYAGSFHSQSATLTTAVNARRRVLASSGTSPMEDLVKHFGVGIYVEPDSSDAVADGMATLLKASLSEPNWEGYEAYATWETNVLRLLQATSDYLSRTPTKARQFEGLEEEAAEIPELLNARRLAHHRTGPQKKKSPSLTKTQNRRKSRKASPQDEREILRSQANGADFHPALPGFDSPASAPVQVNSASRTPASDTMTAADSPSPIPRARRRQRREPAAG